MGISLIVATDKNGVIGNNGSIPWMGKMPSDLKYFKDMTLGKTVIVGRKTWESLPTLHDRKFIIMSREPSTVFFSFEDILDMLEGDEEVFVIGGAEIYRKFLPLANKVYITHIEAEFQGDTFFPKLHPNEWLMISANNVEANGKDKYDATYAVFTRRPM